MFANYLFGKLVYEQLIETVKLYRYRSWSKALYCGMCLIKKKFELNLSNKWIGNVVKACWYYALVDARARWNLGETHLLCCSTGSPCISRSSTRRISLLFIKDADRGVECYPFPWLLKRSVLMLSSAPRKGLLMFCVLKTALLGFPSADGQCWGWRSALKLLHKAAVVT